MSFKIHFAVLCPNSVTSFVIKGQCCSRPLAQALAVEGYGIKEEICRSLITSYLLKIFFQVNSGKF